MSDRQVAYNVSGGFCTGLFWKRWHSALSRTAQDLRSLDAVVGFGKRDARVLSSVSECPEGATSYWLAMFAWVKQDRQQRRQQEELMAAFSESLVRYFSTPVLLRRLRKGAWPDFGMAHILEAEVHRHRFPAGAHLLLDASPRFQIPTPPAPERILQGWWWSRELSGFKGIVIGGDDGTSLDLGMQIVLKRTPLLQHRSEMLLVDVGAFDGTSLLSLGLRAGLNHSVLAFEPLAANRELIFRHFKSRGLLPSLELLDPDRRACLPLGHRGRRAVEHRCRCRGRPQGQGCAVLANVGLSAADHGVKLPVAGAFTSVYLPMETGTGKEPVRLRAGAPIVEWWASEVLGRRCLDVHLLKVDVEGSEFSVLRGLEPLLAEHRVRFLFLELWPLGLMTWGSDPLGVLRWLAHYGFICHFLGTLWASESFEEFVARNTQDSYMTDFDSHKEMKFNDLLCEDVHWADPCGSEAAAAEATRAALDVVLR